ncbi:MAG TPA: leucyl/phenylalanyl-tRNA--protein transferase [Planctomycetota bacterium]|nr:leucyl/phenylalanyl-tRNA--protein transferase [Planctomycetota bacterium]
MPLNPELLEHAYRNACFPMPDWTGRVGWYRPDPRAILPLDRFHVSRSLLKKLKSNYFDVTYDTAFTSVMTGCADREDTWITDEFISAYTDLHKLGKAHSVEVWRAGRLVGGTYGVHLGGAFFAESKFHTETDASKVALARLVERLRARGFALLEVQYLTPHLAQFGVIEIPDAEYVCRLDAALLLDCKF